MRGEVAQIRYVPVGELGEVRMGKQLSPAGRAAPQQYPYLRVANVLDGHIDYSNVKTMGFTEAERAAYSLRPGDILLNEGQSLELVGRSAIYDREEGKFYFQNTLVRFRPRAEVVPQYAQIVFDRWLTTGVFAAIAKKTTSIAHLGADRFAHLPFPLVPLDEQRSIVEALGTATSTGLHVNAAITKLHAIRCSFLERLGDAGLGLLETVLDTGPQNGLYKPESAYGASGTPIVRINSFSGGPSDLTRNLLRVDATSREMKLYGLQTGDVLINRVNTPELVGKSTAVSRLIEPTVFESNLMRCRINSSRTAPEFVEAWLSGTVAKGHFLRRAKSAVSQASINQDDVRSCPFPQVDLEEQQALLRRLKSVDAQIATEMSALAKIEKIRQGLSHGFLNGEITFRRKALRAESRP